MKLIIYSTNGLDPRNSLSLLNSDISWDCEYITTAAKLYESLNNDRPDLIIIDVDDYAGLDTVLRERIDAIEGPSVFLLRHNGEESIREAAVTDKNIILPRKMVLHKGEDSLPSRTSRDRDIVRATAATLGHEINNPLMSIYASAEMILKEDPALSSTTIEKIKRISDEVARIKKSTDILIDVDRVLLKMTPAGNMIDINRIINDKDADDINREDTANKNLDIKPS